LSQSRTAKSDSGSLTRTDLLFAVLLHLLVLTIILVLTVWQQQHKSEPLKRIEVMMISAKQLAKLERQAHNHPKPAIAKPAAAKPKPVSVKPPKKVAKPKPVVKPKIKPKPVVKPKPKPKPTLKPKPKKIVKPVIKAPSIKKPVKTVKSVSKPDDNFDPFAPVSSSTDRSTKKASTSRPELADIAGKQLSNNEKERYIAMMQAAVQQHWKVPAGTPTLADPLVEMQLSADGAVVAVNILESSGSALLDASLVRAIMAAAPFQLPAKQFEFFRSNRIRFHPIK